jgi:hypothetical protein
MEPTPWTVMIVCDGVCVVLKDAGVSVKVSRGLSR